jgi:sulfonate transport system permease protein
VLGTLVGFSRLAEALVDRSVQMVRAVPSWRRCHW